VELLSGGGSYSYQPAEFMAATPDASRVVFQTAGDLIPADTDDCDPGTDVYGCTDVYERSGGVTTLVSTGPAGGNGASDASFRGMSSDGSRVFFVTNEALVASDTDDCDPGPTSNYGCRDVYERSGGTTTLISGGGNGAHDADFAGATDDGSRAFFQTSESLVSADVDSCDNGPDYPPGCPDIYERFGGTTTLVSTGPKNANADSYPNFDHVSTDGSRVIFDSEARLVNADHDSEFDVYERAGGTTTLLSSGPAGGDGPFPAAFDNASADGSHLIFDTQEKLVSADTDACDNGAGAPAGCTDLYERSGGVTSLVSTGPAATNGNHNATGRVMSDDGSRVFFETPESLVAQDTDACDYDPGYPGCYDVYERSGGVTTLVSTGPADPNGRHDAGLAAVSGDGTKVYFDSDIPLVAADTDSCDNTSYGLDPGCYDSYVRSGGQTTLLSTAPGADDLNQDAVTALSGPPWSPGASADGSRTFFVTDGPFLPQDADDCDNGFGNPRGCADVYERAGGVTSLVPAVANNGDFRIGVRAVSEDGTRVILDTPGALLAGDADGGFDLYSATLADGYTRPKGATPVRVALVPAYAACSSANRAHGPPLASGSCNPPAQASPNLTVGTPDANGAQSNSIGYVRLDARPGAAGAPDDADADIAVSLTDVRCAAPISPCGSSNAAAGPDYTGQLRLDLALRLTDRQSGVSETEPATVSDVSYPVTVPCLTTASDSEGASCSITTSVEALTPGAITEGRRAIWQLGQIRVTDGGPDGLASTAGNDLFAVQGVFVP
jgi:hypothetical protein